MKEVRIFLIGGNDDETALIQYDLSHDNDYKIILHYRNKVIERTGEDYFETFCKIRIELEKERLIPFCYGASLNVYPSGMSRDMGRGLKAYKLVMGKKGSMENIVHIFDDGYDVTPSYVDSQQAFFKEWIQSLK